ncbi:sodium ion-translocating decarboxylase subunit beta [Chlorobium sp. N1]|uniref:sodium ion-translocating decarboxylase subunit beta n=1 Tax=Chlorobium sp. N1 TaxID=2491138 RepID=UPI0010404C78|nr:sodium ion-translocating decarboxylase subunit beta [Chlorobium sp. N1]TCD48457.1 sodium ion-translocating decarboxylase subunit beta [Chlorobium sp. N1]
MRKLLMVVFSLLFMTTAGFSQTFFQTEGDCVILTIPDSLELVKVPIRDSRKLQVGDAVREGDFLGLFADEAHNKISVTAGLSGHVTYINDKLYHKYSAIPPGTELMRISREDLLVNVQGSEATTDRLSLSIVMKNLVESTGIYALVTDNRLTWTEGLGRLLMISVGALLIYLAIAKGFEPLLLLPIGMGAIFSNIPLAYINDEGGILYYIFHVGIETGVFPLLIFMGVGAMTDFGPMIANPKTALLGGAAQLGIFSTLIGALLLSQYVPGINFTMKDAASIGIIGGADGPTSIFVASRLSPALLGSIAVAAYSYMALVPIIQPPIMKLFTTEAERKIKMSQLRYVSKREKIIFPIVVILLCAMLLPSAAPLIGFLMFGNLMKECGVVERLSETSQNALINIVTIFLGLGVGSKLSAEKFLNLETLGILVLGLLAFSIGTAGGLLMARFMNLFLKQKINPLIGSAGVSAVPMAARVANKVGLEADPHNFLLMHAMGPNVSGVIGSAVAAGLLLAVFM